MQITIPFSLLKINFHTYLFETSAYWTVPKSILEYIEQSPDGDLKLVTDVNCAKFARATYIVEGDEETLFLFCLKFGITETLNTPWLKTINSKLIS